MEKEPSAWPSAVGGGVISGGSKQQARLTLSSSSCCSILLPVTDCVSPVLFVVDVCGIDAVSDRRWAGAPLVPQRRCDALMLCRQVKERGGPSRAVAAKPTTRNEEFRSYNTRPRAAGSYRQPTHKQRTARRQPIIIERKTTQYHWLALAGRPSKTQCESPIPFGRAEPQPGWASCVRARACVWISARR